MTPLIRQYVESDLDGVLSSWESASKIAHPFLKEEFLETERYNIPNVYLPNTDTWVAEVEGNVVGFIALMGNEVGALFLDPKFHGNGIGKSLMDKARELHETLEVEVFKANSIGREFYDRYGFKLLSESIHEPTSQEVLRLKFVYG
jgi:putative acetyltransferase